MRGGNALKVLEYPPNETERFADLRRYELLDTPPDGSFDRIASITANIFDVPIALVSLVDYDRIWFKARHGLDAEQEGALAKWQRGTALVNALALWNSIQVLKRRVYENGYDKAPVSFAR